jgi:hypothetical protein
METTFRRGLVQGFEGLQEAVLGKSDEAAKKALRNRGLGPEYLGYARQGGKYYGDDLVRSLLPDSDAVAAALKQMDNEITILKAGGQEKEAQALTDKQAGLEALKKQSAVVLTVRNTLEDTMKAVANGDSDTLYGGITEDLKNKGFLDVVAAVEESGGKESFKAEIAKGYSQGNKVQLALEWMVEKQLFKLGRSGEASSAHQDALVNYLATFSEDIGEAIDDSILELDLGASFVVEQNFWAKDAVDKNPANVALRFMTSGPEDMHKFVRAPRTEVRPEPVRGIPSTPAQSPGQYGITGLPHEPNTHLRGNL